MANAPWRTSRSLHRITAAHTRRPRLDPDSRVIEPLERALEVSGQPGEAAEASTRALPRSCCRDVRRAGTGRRQEGIHGPSGGVPGYRHAALRSLHQPPGTAPTLASSVVRKCSTSLPPWWQSVSRRRTPLRIVAPTSTTCTANRSMRRLESQTIATASPSRSLAPWSG